MFMDVYICTCVCVLYIYMYHFAIVVIFVSPLLCKTDGVEGKTGPQYPANTCPR